MMMVGSTPKESEEVLSIQKFTGLVNVAPAYRLEPGELVTATNVDIDDRGTISRRAGYSKLNSLNIENLWSDDALALFTSGTNLYRLETDMSYAVIASGLGTARMVYVSVNNRVYFTNTVMQGVYADGAARSWGLAVPRLPVAIRAPGMLPAGTYQYALTYSRSDGQESGAGVAGVIQLVADSGVSFSSIPQSSDPGVSLVNLYVSPQNGDTLYFVASVANGTTDHLHLGGALSGSYPLTTQHYKRLPIGQEVAFYRGRMYVASGSVLYPSLPYNYELSDPRDFIDFTSKITLLAPVLGGMFVATENNKCHFLRGEDYTSFVPEQVTTTGAVPGSLVYAPPEVIGDGNAVGPVAIWESSRGRCLGFGDGKVVNVTASKYEYDSAPVAAGLFMQSGGVNQHISVLRG